MKTKLQIFAILLLIISPLISSCGSGKPSAEKMAEALKTVGWIEYKGDSISIVTPMGVMGGDGYPDYKAMLTDEDLNALAKIDVTPEQFVAGMKVLSPSDGSVDAEYKASVASYLSK